MQAVARHADTYFAGIAISESTTRRSSAAPGFRRRANVFVELCRQMGQGRERCDRPRQAARKGGPLSGDGERADHLAHCSVAWDQDHDRIIGPPAMGQCIRDRLFVHDCHLGAGAIRQSPLPPVQPQHLQAFVQRQGGWSAEVGIAAEAWGGSRDATRVSKFASPPVCRIAREPTRRIWSPGSPTSSWLTPLRS